MVHLAADPRAIRSRLMAACGVTSSGDFWASGLCAVLRVAEPASPLQLDAQMNEIVDVGAGDRCVCALPPKAGVLRSGLLELRCPH